MDNSRLTADLALPNLLGIVRRQLNRVKTNLLFTGIAVAVYS